MRLKDTPITVAGGGVAGLAAACALARRGARVTLCERADAMREVGAGLQISPNGARVLGALGCTEALDAASLRAGAVCLRDGRSSRPVLRMDLSRASGAYRFIHRARLIDLLADAARGAGVDIRLSSPVEPGQGGDLVVACDGLHSRHRAALNGDVPPFFTGQVAWRAVIDDDKTTPEAQVFMGPGRHLVSYPLPGGRRNIVAVEEREVWTEEGWTQTDDPTAVRLAFAGFGGPVPGWLDRLDTVHLWGLFRHPVAARWHGEGVVLAGDAAHPTLPFLAQGANMALEDALVLATALDTLPLDRALPAYQAARAARTARIVKAATANARNYHLRGPARLLAHAALRGIGLLAPDAMRRRFDWLYDYDATDVFR